MTPKQAEEKARDIVQWHCKGECVCEKSACLDDIASMIASALLAAERDGMEQERKRCVTEIEDLLDGGRGHNAREVRRSLAAIREAAKEKE